MSKTYTIDGAEYRFEHAFFDKLIRGSGDGAYKAMGNLAKQCNFSVPAIKDWRFGKSAPSDIEKVDSIAAYYGLAREDLLIAAEREDKSMEQLGDVTGREGKNMRRLTGEQARAFAEVCVEIGRFFEAANRAELFVWKEYDLDTFAPSLVEDVIPSPLYQRTPSLADKMHHGEKSVYAYDLHQQLVTRAFRALERQRPWLGRMPVYDELGELIVACLDGFAYDGADGDEQWIPDPDLLFEREPGDTMPCHMRRVEAEAFKRINELCERYLG